MQAFLSVRNELIAEQDVPDEIARTLQAHGWPPIAHTSKVAATQASAQHGESFFIRFASAPPPKLAPVGPGGDPMQAVLQILGAELGTSPLFSPAVGASAILVRRAISAAATAGLAVPQVWDSGEIARRGALRRLPWVLLERTEPPNPQQIATALCALPSNMTGLSALPRHGSADALLDSLRKIAIDAGATELDAPLARLAAACRETYKPAPTPPTLMLHREALCPPPVPAPTEAPTHQDGAIELEATAPQPELTADASAGCGALAPWASAAVGDVRLLDATGEPWDLIRGFCHVVKARWLIDVLRRTPGSAPRCNILQLLRAHDASQAMLAQRNWLPASIVAPGSSSAKLAETFPEELCPNY